MKRAAVLGLVLVLLALTISCAGKQKTEVVVVTYESVAIALKTAYVYLTERENNKTLVGEDLVTAKKSYAIARGKFLEAGDMLKNAIQSPGTFDQATYQKLLEEAAKIAASLSKGGR